MDRVDRDAARADVARQAAIAAVSADQDEPAGLLKVSMSLTFGINQMVPLLPAFLARYPLIRADWRFESRQVDLITEDYDAAIGGGFDLAPGVVARTLAPAHVIAVASPAYMAGRTPPADPGSLAVLDGIVMRSPTSGCLVQRMMRNAIGVEQPALLSERLMLDDPAATRQAALSGLGVALLAVPDVIADIERGALLRLLPQWYADLGPISIYYASRTLLPAKTRAFIDFVADAFRRGDLARRFAGSIG